MNWLKRLFWSYDKPILLAWGPNNFRRREMEILFNREAKMDIEVNLPDRTSYWRLHRVFLRSVDMGDPYFSFSCYPTERDVMNQDLKYRPKSFPPEPFV